MADIFCIVVGANIHSLCELFAFRVNTHSVLIKPILELFFFFVLKKPFYSSFSPQTMDTHDLSMVLIYNNKC